MAWTPPAEDEVVKPWTPPETDEEVKAPSKLESAGYGAAQGATFNFADEGAAVTVAAAKKLGDLLTKTKGGDPIENYRKARDYFRGKIDKAEEANPKTFMAGQFAGAAATAPLGEGAAGLLPMIGKSAIAKMAALGGLQGLGASNADLTKGDIGGAARDTAVGAGLGAVVGGAAKGIGKVVSKAVDPEFWQNRAQNWGKSALGFTKRFLNTSEKLKAANEAAQTMLDKGVITPGADAQEMAFKVNDLVKDTGEKIGSFLKTREGGYDTQSAIDAINSLRPKNSAGVALSGGNYDPINNMLDKAVDTVKAHGDTIPFEEANKLKGFLQDLVNWNSTNAESSMGQNIAGSVKGSIDQNLEKVATPDEFEDFLKNKQIYGSGKLTQKAMDNQLSSIEGNNALGLTDWMAAAATHDPVLAAPTIAAKHVTQNYGSQTIAWGADKAAKGLKATGDRVANLLHTNPQALGKYAGILGNAARQGAQALSVRHFVMSNTDPEYRMIIRNMEDDSGENTPKP